MPLPKPKECIGCPLYEKGIGFSKPEGTGSLNVMIVGEALGFHESREGLPFRPTAPAGSLLERTIKACGFDRQQFKIWNVVACQPPGDWLEGAPWEAGAINHCKVHFNQVYNNTKPRVIFALGNTALSALTGHAGKARGISAMRGYALPMLKYGKEPCSECNGNPQPNCFFCGGAGEVEAIAEDTNTIVVPSFHPSYLRRGATELIGVLGHDLKRAVHIAQNGFVKQPVEYVTHPSIDEARSFLLRVKEQESRGLLTYDIETPRTRHLDEDKFYEDETHEIISIQFSLGPRTGIFFPWTDGYIQIASEVLGSSIEKAGHNIYKFDNPRIKSHGIAINGFGHDTMWLWHHLQPDLPAGLQFVANFYGMDFPWKHLSGVDDEFYGCADVDAPQRMIPGMLQDLKRRGIERGYIQHIVHMEPILQAATDRGIPVNDTKRLEFAEELKTLQKEEYLEILALAPLECSKIEPKDGYKGVPPKVKAAIAAGTMIEGGLPGQEVDAKSGKVKEFIYKLHEFEEVDPADPGKTVTVEKWVRKYQFNPNAQKDILNYMKVMKHPVPKKLKEKKEDGSAKDDTGKKELERLASKLKTVADKLKDPELKEKRLSEADFYLKIIRWKEYDKMLGTYIKGWAPDKNGRVHGTFYYDTGTGQLAAKNPNTQNAPKHGKNRCLICRTAYEEGKKPFCARCGKETEATNLAKKFRGMIEAPPGFKIIEIDYTAFHALTLGFEAKDLDYMRLARLDIHSFVTAHFLKLPEREKLIALPDEELKDRLKVIKKAHTETRDKKAKPGILGIGFGLQKRNLYHIHRDSFNSEAEAGRVLSMVQGLFPKVFKWQDDIRLLAHKQTYLRSKHEYIRWLFDVYHWESKRGCLVPGNDAEKAIAFLPANDAFGMIKEVMLKLDGIPGESENLNNKFGFANQIHDALMFVCPDPLVDECLSTVPGAMMRPSKFLVDPISAPGGLICGAVPSVGQNWSKMEEIDLKKGMAAR